MRPYRRTVSHVAIAEPNQSHHEDAGGVGGRKAGKSRDSDPVDFHQGERQRRTYPIGNGTTHAGNQRDAATISEPNHLLGNCLSGHEHASHVDFEHRVGVLRGVLESRSLLLDSGGSHQSIQATFDLANRFDDAVQQLGVPDVNATVVEFRAQFLASTLLDFVELGGLARGNR